jgi:hypothetical protein
MLTQQAVVAKDVVAGDATPAKKSSVSRTWSINSADLATKIVAVSGYGDTANTLVLKVLGIELLPNETSFIAAPIYASGLDVFKLVGKEFDTLTPIGVMITTFKPRV